MLISVLRAAILYLLVILGLRLMGKRQIGELEPSELVLSLLIADLAAVPMQDFGLPLLMGVVPILTLLCLSAVLSVLTVKSIRFRAVLCGRPSVVVSEGKILVSEMRKNRFTVDELMEELRVAGITDLSRVKYAVLETTGRVSVLPYAADQPPSAREQGLKVKGPGLPITLISDGRVIGENLVRCGHDEAWLNAQCRQRGAASPKEVFLLTCDAADGIYFCKKEPRK